MENLDYIIAMVVFCAGALAFIVLYNLTNINITERTREIATVKVLGFFPRETASYVFSENMVLCVISALVGLPAGKLLHAFVMAQIKIDMMRFDVRISLLSLSLIHISRRGERGGGGAARLRQAQGRSRAAHRLLRR